MIKKLFLFPPLAPLAVSVPYLLFGNLFFFAIWFFVFLILALIFWPIWIGSDDKNVPVLQVFASMLIFFAIFFVALFKDFKAVGYAAPDALIYGFLGGLTTVALIMFLKGN